jgi:hypothetical protein
VGRNRLLTRIRKILAVQPRISLHALDHALARDYRPIVLPEPGLRSLCGQLPWCRVEGQYLKAASDLTQRKVLSGDEAIVCEALRSAGGVVPLKTLRQVCFAKGVGKSNLWRILQSSPVIRRVDKQLYGLTGT